uniref:Uncharacterized protein n=1 Tax=Pyramimonas orientalis virus TaxID=455367 RepID=A0A7M3UPD9_POV01|nr:hypothetical protein HWQ62_00493 [Pyramimonas orientalis virus]
MYSVTHKSSSSMKVVPNYKRTKGSFERLAARLAKTKGFGVKVSNCC